jgi:hypothetical protein
MAFALLSFLRRKSCLAATFCFTKQKNISLSKKMEGFIKNSKTIRWTMHSRAKMRYYGLSESRVKRVLNSPKRIEEGIAPKTVAMMQSAGSKKHPYEIWAMIQDSPSKRKIISAWRYPGITKTGEPLPDEVLKEIRGSLNYID